MGEYATLVSAKHEQHRRALKAELAESYEALTGVVEECVARIRMLEAERAEAYDALRWYAGDGSTYDGIDVGQKARAVLERYGQAK